jgi:hypothetical protein
MKRICGRERGEEIYEQKEHRILRRMDKITHVKALSGL